jgi:hypothetical protein
MRKSKLEAIVLVSTKPLPQYNRVWETYLRVVHTLGIAPELAYLIEAEISQ